MSSVKNYLSLIKFSHTIFAMPFALIGFFLGIRKLPTANLNGVLYLFEPPMYQKIILFFQFRWYIFLLVIACMIFARSAAMAFNRYLDRDIDASNPRTAIREIPSGIISSRNALAFTIGSCILFIICTWFINIMCFLLSPVALFVILFYSYTKRFTSLCHLVLGLGLSLAPIGAYLAVTGVFHWLPLLFSFAVICWVSGFDIIYALQDEGFDRQHNLQSIPARLGKKNALMVSVFLHMFSAGFVIIAGFTGGFGWLYWIGTGVFCALLIYQHSLVKPIDISRVNIAFMTANGIASVVFAFFVILDLWLKAL
ncbi:MAG: UbiA-like polyprenyltransferase [Ferruginibacter sp.]